jgi:UDP-N-acetylglucosamine 3-dehydrogenase
VTGDRRVLRAGVIGLGSMGSNHARVYAEIAGVELAAVADTSPDRLAAVARAARYGDYRDMLARESLDIVSVCVPTLLHREVALAAIAKGVAALVEKPIAATIDDGEAIARAAQDAGVPLMVGHVERFNPAVLEVKRLVASGDVGPVYQLYARRTGPFPQRVRDVGVVHDLAPHDIDVMRYLLCSAVQRVFAETLRGVATEHEDMLWGILRFESGAVGVLNVNWLTPLKVRRLSVLAEKGLIEADYLSQQVTLYRGGDGVPPRDAAPRAMPVEKAEPLRLELGAFTEAVRRGVAPPVTAADGLAALEVASLLVESARTGCAVAAPARRPA